MWGFSMGESKIEWCDCVWNPTRGCSLVSPGCTNCYAMKQAHRFSGPGRAYEGLTRLRDKGGPVWTGKIVLVPEALVAPLTWRRPSRVFVNSMSDLFHEGLTNEQIAAVFGVMAACPKHTFQVLTKRADRMLRWFDWVARQTPDPWTHCHSEALARDNEEAIIDTLSKVVIGRPWPLPNVWIGVSVEDQPRAEERIPLLLNVPAMVRFLSIEPLLGPVDLRKWFRLSRFKQDYDALIGKTPGGEQGIPDHLRWNGVLPQSLHWAIVGGESGNGARSCEIGWIREVVRVAKICGVPVFVKQLGAWPEEHIRPTGASDDGGDMIPLRLESKKGGDPAEWPEDLRVREFPFPYTASSAS
jgi:protein gp37